jgi:RNA polymerase sigma factor (sigma-70 family)
MSESPDESDEALMLAYAAGDASAFARLYDRHERPVHRYFLRQGAAAAQADDLLQETWMAVVRSAERYTVDARFTTWLYRIARSKLIDHWRATRQQVLLDDAANDPELDDDIAAIDRIAASDALRPDVQAMSRQQAASFVAAVEALPAAQREVFLLHLDGELTMEQMAGITDVGVETAKSRLRYAMKRVRAACADWLLPRADERAQN